MNISPAHFVIESVNGINWTVETGTRVTTNHDGIGFLASIRRIPWVAHVNFEPGRLDFSTATNPLVAPATIIDWLQATFLRELSLIAVVEARIEDPEPSYG